MKRIPEHNKVIQVIAKSRVLSRIDSPGTITVAGYTVKINSLRMKTFLYKGLDCAFCHLHGKYFALEYQRNNKLSWCKPHISLYGIDRGGTHVLMTHDHIIARVFYGQNNLSNTQTLCVRCNANKSAVESMICNAIYGPNKELKAE